MDLRTGFDIKRYIRTIPDYPKPGILFRDITTLLSNLHAFRAAIDELAWPFLQGEFDYVAGIEARGFILGGAVAHVLGRGFIPIRKKGKLPARTIGQEYALEYGVDTIEIHADAIKKGDRILLIDVLARKAGEERDPSRSDGIGEGQRCNCPSSIPFCKKQNGPLSSPVSLEKTSKASCEQVE